MATSSVNLLGQVITVTANVSADPTSNANVGSLQSVLFQYYGLIYLGGTYSAGQVTLQLQDTNNPQLSALSIVGAVSDALAASVGQAGSNIQANLPATAALGGALISTSTFPPGSPSSSVIQTGGIVSQVNQVYPMGGGAPQSPLGYDLSVLTSDLVHGRFAALGNDFNQIWKDVWGDLQTGAILLLVVVAVIAILVVMVKS